MERNEEEKKDHEEEEAEEEEKNRVTKERPTERMCTKRSRKITFQAKAFQLVFFFSSRILFKRNNRTSGIVCHNGSTVPALASHTIYIIRETEKRITSIRENIMKNPIAVM